MKYNDNFVLPPDNILEKMREDYKATSAKAHILKEKVVDKLQIPILPQNAFNNLYRSNFYREQLKRTTGNRYTRQRLERLIDRTDKNIDRFGGLYGGLQRVFVPPRIGVSRDYCQLLKDAIVAEVDAITELFELIKESGQESVIQTLFEIIEERLEVLRELTSLLSECHLRRF